MKLNLAVDLESMADEYGETIAQTIKNELEYQCKTMVRKVIKEQLQKGEAEVKRRVVKLSAGTLERLLKELDIDEGGRRA